MKEKLFAMFLLALLLFWFSPALAQDTPKKVFSQMDTDGDGNVTREEFMTVHMEAARKIREARFSQLDTDGDGKITKDEFMAVQMEEAQRIGEVRFSRVDKNKDGVLSQEEVAKRFRLIKETMGRLREE